MTTPAPQDRRRARCARGVAHVSRQGQVQADRYVAGVAHRVIAPLADLCQTPAGARERQLLLGAGFTALVAENGWTYGFDATGYCGWVPTDALGPDAPVTHWIRAAASHAYSRADLKSPERAALSLGARVAVLENDNGFARTALGWIPHQHLSPVHQLAPDPVSVARQFLGVPYLWGGNSHAGLDCSALVQAALLACGIECPGDSDQQAAMPWVPVTPGREQPGDLIFWPGHVAMVTEGAAQGAAIIHANAHHMAVVEEPMQPALDRIAAKGDAVSARLRPSVVVT